jgi:uncharacterized protein YuzE
MNNKIKNIRRFNQQFQALSFSELMRTADAEFLEFVAELDEQGNPLLESKFDAEGQLEERNEFSYDNNGKLIAHTLFYAVDDVSEKKQFKRDDKGRLIEEVKIYGEDIGERIQYEYDEHGRICSIIRYDEEGDFDFRESLTYNLKGDMESRIKYGSNDRLIESFLFNFPDERTIEEKELDAAGKVVGVTLVKKDEAGREVSSVQTTAEGKLISSMLATYDVNGNVIQKQYKDFYSKTVCYAYDESNRMISQELFDATGLLLRKNVYEYDEFDNLLTEKVFEIDASRAGRDKHYQSRYEYEYFSS